MRQLTAARVFVAIGIACVVGSLLTRQPLILLPACVVLVPALRRWGMLRLSRTTVAIVAVVGLAFLPAMRVNAGGQFGPVLPISLPSSARITAIGTAEGSLAPVPSTAWQPNTLTLTLTASTFGCEFNFGTAITLSYSASGAQTIATTDVFVIAGLTEVAPTATATVTITAAGSTTIAYSATVANSPSCDTPTVTGQYLANIDPDGPAVAASPISTSVVEGTPLEGSVSFTPPGDDMIDTWNASADYGDGNGPQPLTPNGSGGFDFSHTYGEGPA